MTARALLAAALLVLPRAAAAQERRYPWEFRVEGERDNLGNGYEDWRELLGQVAWKPRRSLALLGGARATERFGLRDREAFAGVYLPLAGDATVFHVEATASNTHRVLARSSALAEVSRVLGGGWVATLSAKGSRYPQNDVAAYGAGIERYFGDFRVGYQGIVSRPDGASWSPAHRFSASWHRGDLTFVTLTAARGRDVENVVPTGLLVLDVRSFSLRVGWEVMPWWGLTLELLHERQGDLYTRRGVRVGTRVLF